MREYHVLSLGAGVQSTTIYLMILDGELPIKLDAAVFADTGEEPASVYAHLGWLTAQGGPPIVVLFGGAPPSFVNSFWHTSHYIAAMPRKKGGAA